MSKNSTAYLIFFASMVTLVSGVALALTATILKPRQLKNIALEKKMFILSAINFHAETPQQYEEAYDKYIEGIVIDKKGNVLKGEETFEINPVEQDALLAEDPSAQAKFPLYKYHNPDSNKTAFIVPVNGKGLWGPIWGYVALDENYTTIKGAIFDHKGETPGLGAEIAGTVFQQNFKNKKIYDEKGKFTSILVLKGSGNEADEHEVDGISGATITGKGVTAMLQKDLKKYEPYFKKGSR